MQANFQWTARQAVFFSRRTHGVFQDARWLQHHSCKRKHLETRWGSGLLGRQDGVLLLAITMEPASRLGSENDAKGYLDDVCTEIRRPSWYLAIVLDQQVETVALVPVA